MTPTWSKNGVDLYLGDCRDVLPTLGKVGQGDITGLNSDGVRIEIECKLRKNTQSDAQVMFADMIRRMGGIYILAFSVEDVTSILG